MTIPHDYYPNSSPIFFSEPDHRLAEHLTILAAIIQGQVVALRHSPELISRDAASAAMQDTAARIVAIANLHRLLACAIDPSEIDLRIILKESVDEIVKTLCAQEYVHVRYQLHAEFTVDVDEAALLVMIFCEIVTNSIRFARAAKVPSVLSMSCTQGAEGGTVLEISDDAVGLREGTRAVREGGVGVKLIRSMAERIGAELTVNASAHGLSYRFMLPVTEIELVAAD